MTYARFLIAAGHEKRTDGRQATALALALIARGHDAVILRPRGHAVPSGENDSPPTLFWPSPRPTTIADATFLRHTIRRLRPTHLVANFGAVNLMMLVGWLQGVSHRVCWYHTLTSQLDFDSRLPRWRAHAQRLRKRGVYRLASHIVANSYAARDDVVTAFAVPASKVVVFPNFVADPLSGTADRPHEPVIGETGPHIVCVGRLHPSKGQDVLLRAVAPLLHQHPTLRVTFLGGGPSLDAYRTLAQEVGVAHACRFLGGVSRDEVLQQLRQATVAVVPSREEAFGFVNIEALSVGTPVVASRVGGIPDIVRHGVEGFLFPPGDHHALGSYIGSLITDDALRADMSQRARVRFLTAFEEASVLRDQISWLESLADRGGTASHVA